MQGVSSEQEAKQAILTFLSDQKLHNNQEIVNDLKSISKMTVYKYLYKDRNNSLVSLGMVKKRPGPPEDNFRPRYKITEKGLEHYQKTSMLSEHTKELMALSRNELVQRLVAYKVAAKATFNVLVKRKVWEALNEGRNFISAEEINDVAREIRREMARTKGGDLYGKDMNGKNWLKEKSTGDSS